MCNPIQALMCNMAALFSVAKMGDTILAMSLDHGGHLTHGSAVNFRVGFLILFHMA